jgi:hypothetical protein
VSRVRLRTLHLGVGLGGVVVFLGTGIYMRMRFPELYALNETLRYIYRANHVYVLFASLVNLALGAWFVGIPAGWRSKLATAGSLLALASPIVLCLAFVLEAPEAVPERILTLLGVFAAAIGVAAHVVSGAVSR